ncbi:MAG: class I SAM-dependent methyltransferase [Polyangiaceae bacterium]
MSHQMFDESAAAAYDDRFKKLAVFRDALQLVTRLALTELSDTARVLCVGAGTGLELLYLAEAFPTWQFVAVEPSEPMLKHAIARCDAAGISSRCSFHHGTTDTLEDQGPFDGATALLVSQFLVDPEARTSFFRDIAQRLKPGAPLVSADLAHPVAGELTELWRRAWIYNDTTAENVERMLQSIGQHVAVAPPEVVEAHLTAAGFSAPTRCFQTLWIHGWVSRRS